MRSILRLSKPCPCYLWDKLRTWPNALEMLDSPSVCSLLYVASLSWNFEVTLRLSQCWVVLAFSNVLSSTGNVKQGFHRKLLVFCLFVFYFKTSHVPTSLLINVADSILLASCIKSNVWWHIFSSLMKCAKGIHSKQKNQFRGPITVTINKYV